MHDEVVSADWMSARSVRGYLDILERLEIGPHMRTVSSDEDKGTIDTSIA